MCLHLPGSIEYALTALVERGFEAYLVGGCVRDHCLGKTPHDYDLCTNAKPEEICACFSGEKLVLSGMKHGTVGVLAEGQKVEITSYRKEEGYSDRRHPDKVCFVGDIRTDLSRRDFTINAMAMDKNGYILDFFGGREDLAAGRIRAVGIAQERFKEDPLRILRGLRFSSQLGFFIEEQTAWAMEKEASLLSSVSGERLCIELKGLLFGVGKQAVLEQFYGVLCQFLPVLSEFVQVADYDYTGNAFSIHLAQLFASAPVREAEAQLERLHVDRETMGETLFLLKQRSCPLPTEPESLGVFLLTHGEEKLLRLLTFRKKEAMAKTARVLYEGCKARCCALSLQELAIGGRELLAMGFSPGKGLGEELKRLFLLQLRGETVNEGEALLSRLRRP